MPIQELNLYKTSCMGANAIAEEMNTYFSQLTEAEQESVLQLIKTFVGTRVHEEKETIDIQQYNKDIDESLAEFERGEFYTHEEAIEIMKSI